MKIESIPAGTSMTDQDAAEMSRCMAEPGMPPEARQWCAHCLFDYYRAILMRTERPAIPTPRRWL